MSVPYIFANQSGNVPLSELDANFANVSAHVDTAGTVTTNAQPNITSVGTLTSVSVTGNVRGGNINGQLYTGTTISVSGNITGGNLKTAGQVSATGNITGANLILNGALSASGNAATGNLAVTGVINSTGTITGGNLATPGGLYSAGNVLVGQSINVEETVSAVGNIVGNYILGNGSQLTGIGATYNDGNVVDLLAAFGSNTISTTGNVTVGYILGDGSQLTGVTANYGNSNVVLYGESGWGGNIIPSANVTYTLGNSTNWWANAWFGSNTIYIGGIPLGVSDNVLTFNSANVITANAGGTLDVSTISITGNVSAGNVVTPGQVSATGNIITSGYFLGNFAGNITGNLVVPGSNTQILYNDDGNAGASTALTFNTGTNILATTGNISATANITGGNMLTAGIVSATGNITGGNIDTSGSVAALTVGATANITGGNILTAGIVSATGNITGSYFIGNGSQLTGIATGSNYSNANVAAYLPTYTGNLSADNISASGINSSTGNVIGGNVLTAGIVSATGNITGNYILGNGSQLTGLPATYGDSNVVSLLGSFGSNSISTTGSVSAGNVTASKYTFASVNDSITAAGNSQSTATLLAHQINIVSLVSTGEGVVLPAAVAGMTIYVTNATGNSLFVYPGSGSAIDTLGANNPVTQAANLTVQYIAPTATQWYSVGAVFASSASYA